MKALVIAEHDNEKLNPSTLNIISAVCELSDRIDVIVIGYKCQKIADILTKYAHIDQVIIVDDISYRYQLAESITSVILDITDDYHYIAMSSSTTGKNLIPRIAALLDVDPITDIIKIIDSNTFVRPIYAGNAMETLRSVASKKVMSFRNTSFESVETGNNSINMIQLNVTTNQNLTSYVSENKNETCRPDLSIADIVLSGGRGVGSADNFTKIFDLSDKLGAAVGASRAAVDAEFITNDLQVGQTGKIIAPSLYIAFGISGAIQHIAGIKDSKIIVAVNKDEDAPIFEVSNYGLVADLFDVIKELKEKL